MCAVIATLRPRQHQCAPGNWAGCPPVYMMSVPVSDLRARAIWPHGHMHAIIGQIWWRVKHLNLASGGAGLMQRREEPEPAAEGSASQGCARPQCPQ